MYPVSPHYPSLAGGIVSVTGELVIDTGLRELQTFVASINAASMTANLESKVCWSEVLPASGSSRKVKVRVQQGGTNDGTLGVNPVSVSWFALGV